MEFPEHIFQLYFSSVVLLSRFHGSFMGLEVLLLFRVFDLLSLGFYYRSIFFFIIVEFYYRSLIRLDKYKF